MMISSRWLYGFGCIAAGAIALAILSRVVFDHEGKQQPSAPEGAGHDTDIDSIRLQVSEFCGNCHAVPSPDTFPKDAWYAEVAQGFNFYRESGRTDLAVPRMTDVVAYYRSQAPERLTVHPLKSSGRSKSVRFSKQPIPIPKEFSFPAVSYLHWEPDKGARGRLFFCDMRAGTVRLLQPETAQPLRIHELSNLDNPAHVESYDLDQDGASDLIVSDLGSFQPADHENGRVVWLRYDRDRDKYETIVLAENLGRVADARSADFDGDGDLDLIVAEFGWQKTGRIILLEQVGRQDDKPRFELRVIDKRHGAIHVPVVDLNDDGRPDFVALISQEHETIDAFLNLGNGRFQRKPIFAAGDPSFGSSGIELIDLDKDGDIDVLYTNGDSLDSHYLKPYHAIRWLENRGAFPFVAHTIVKFPGVSRALAGDLDGDGDYDIIACSYLPATLLQDVEPGKYDSLVWLEQIRPGEFTPHRLEGSEFGHLSLAIGDFDGDDDLDLAVGNHANSQRSRGEWLSIWWNQTARPTRR